MKHQWDPVKIIRDNGEQVDGIAPIIISASRSTDIPAFFTNWFFNRLEKGYVKWVNPFNNLTPQFISFEKVRVIVFWSKNPKPIISHLDKLDKHDINYYFQFTVNDYEKENFEPNVPSLDERIETMKVLSEKIGREKVIWRFDPLILNDELTINGLLEKIQSLGDRILSFTNKLIYSYVDISEYQKVQNNLIKDNFGFTKSNVLKAEFTNDQKIEFAIGLQKILIQWKKINPKFKIATCAEVINLSNYEIEKNKCIDDDLMIDIFKSDKKLMNFLGYEEDLFNTRSSAQLKDKGQRKACGCILSKDIGSYNTCNHLCTYCYANTSRKVVKSNQNIIRDDAESILDCS
jgi:DNA repair photolyase